MPQKNFSQHIRHFQRQAFIESYDSEGFSFSGVYYKGSLLSLPSGLYAWDAPSNVSCLSMINFSPFLQELKTLDLFLIGTGSSIEPLAFLLKEGLKNHKIIFDVMSTDSAVRTANVLILENRLTGAALFSET